MRFALVVLVIIGLGCVASSEWWFNHNARACYFAKGIKAAVGEVVSGDSYDIGYHRLSGDVKACWWIGETL